MKPTFTNHLKSLMLGGALALSAGQSSKAAAVPAPSSQPDSQVDLRVAKIRAALDPETRTAVIPGTGSENDGAGLMWWRNAWGNGGWHNWHNGWNNWHGGGWGNWHNW